MRLLLAVFRLYCPFLIVFFMFRIGLLLASRNMDWTIYGACQALWLGVRFDVMTIAYLLFPLIVAKVFGHALSFRKKGRRTRWGFRYFFFCWSLSLALCFIDVVYFVEFFQRLSAAAFVWLKNPGETFLLMLSDLRSVVLFIVFIGLIALGYHLLKPFYNTRPRNIFVPFWKRLITSLLVFFLVLLGIRGRWTLHSYPLSIRTASFFDKPFLNQLGLNPVFTLLKSSLDASDARNKPLNLMPYREAFATVRKHLNLPPSSDRTISRNITPNPDTTASKPKNVILILMESMSAQYMARHGNTAGLTPFLDSLSKESIYFKNTFTTGIHTFNGVFGTLYGLPSSYDKQPLDAYPVFKSAGLTNTLHELGYTTSYFTTHSQEHGNIGSFLKLNGIRHIIGAKDYPKEALKTLYGVPDDYMFRFSLPLLDQFHHTSKPFLAVFMTISNHKPYYIPDRFALRKDLNMDRRVVAYADWSLKTFFQSIRSKPWFKNTLLVFIADHGRTLPPVHYDIPLSCLHTPLLFYSPERLPKTFGKISSQMDVFPTIMGMLNLPYENHTMGIDLMRENRTYAPLGNDLYAGAIDTSHLFTLGKKGSRRLFKHRTQEPKDQSDLRPKKMQEMDQFVRAHLQSFQYIYDHNKH